MKRTRAQLKTDLMNQAEALIDELLDWTDKTAEPSLTQIEEVVLKLRQRLSEQMALAAVDAQASSRPSPGPKCPRCQREMHYKAMKNTTVESRTGSLRLKRGYYYCETCQEGLFPPGSSTADLGSTLE